MICDMLDEKSQSIPLARQFGPTFGFFGCCRREYFDTLKSIAILSLRYGADLGQSWRVQPHRLQICKQAKAIPPDRLIHCKRRIRSVRNFMRNGHASARHCRHVTVDIRHRKPSSCEIAYCSPLGSFFSLNKQFLWTSLLFICRLNTSRSSVWV